MGGGNAQKSAMARAKNLEKAKAAGKGNNKPDSILGFCQMEIFSRRNRVS